MRRKMRVVVVLEKGVAHVRVWRPGTYKSDYARIAAVMLDQDDADERIAVARARGKALCRQLNELERGS